VRVPANPAEPVLLAVLLFLATADERPAQFLLRLDTDTRPRLEFRPTPICIACVIKRSAGLQAGMRPCKTRFFFSKRRTLLLGQDLVRGGCVNGASGWRNVGRVRGVFAFSLIVCTGLVHMAFSARSGWVVVYPWACLLGRATISFVNYSSL
jgi:hypothetical protein